ncbi:MAG: hypothetical protein ACJ71J_01525 [Nitrososphaeraceae archaeon]
MIIAADLAVALIKLDHRHESSSADSSSSGRSDKSGDTGSDAKISSDNSNNEDNSGNNKNNDRGTNDNQQQQEPGSNDDNSNTGIDNNLQAVGSPKTGEREQQGTGRIVSPGETISPPPPLPPATCEQGSTCPTHDQQDLSNHGQSTTTTTSTKDNTPFFLPIPFPLGYW